MPMHGSQCCVECASRRNLTNLIKIKQIIFLLDLERFDRFLAVRRLSGFGLASEVNLHSFGGGDGVGELGLRLFLEQAYVLVAATIVP